jgi:hypothetical protein
MLNLPLGLVTVAGITRPVPADLEQLPNVIAQENLQGVSDMLQVPFAVVALV